ncbi:hypothetical protein BHE74_00006807 [Ensete ventricosum]|nr:hypothetical protein BHE74_00006807 [Ensete ventricosum]
MAPTAKNTSARGIPPRCSARPAHSIILFPIQHTDPIDRSVSNEEERKREESTARLRRRESGAPEARPLSPPVPSSYDSPVDSNGGPKERLARYYSVLGQAQAEASHGLLSSIRGGGGDDDGHISVSSPFFAPTPWRWPPEGFHPRPPPSQPPTTPFLLSPLWLSPLPPSPTTAVISFASHLLLFIVFLGDVVFVA